MKRFPIYIVLATILLIHGCSGEPAPPREILRPVKTIIVGQQNADKQWTFAGTAEDALETDLSFRVAGKIVNFPADQIGRKFSKGQILARLDPADYDLELRQADANLQQIRANYIRAEADVKRIRQLFDRKVISRSELDQSEADFKSYEAQLSASSKKLDIARKRLNYTTLYAPFDGWVGNVKTNIHQNVQSGQGIISFNAGLQMKMYVSVPDTLISQIQEGGDVAVIFDALPGRILNGKVMEISVGSNQGSTYPVKVYLDNTDKAIRSGMSGQVKFIGHTNGNGGIFLPPAAVTSSSDGVRSVWLVDVEKSTVTSHPVSLGILTVHGIEILAGVKPGDMVVIRGVNHLKEGLKVRFHKNGMEG
jgi:RND family efflux transporter MFP subunit